MASANEPADLFVIAEDTLGNQSRVFSFRSDGPVAAGFSPDGVLANTTVDKQMKVPIAGPVLQGGWKVRVFTSLDAADGIDASDCIMLIPITFSDGSIRQLSTSDIGFTTDLPASTPATSLLELGTGYTIPEGTTAQLGGGPIVMSLEDDTA